MAVGYRSASNTGNAVDLGSSINVPVPAGVQAGDVVVVFLGQWAAGGTPTVTPPSGFASAGTWTSGDSAAKNSVWWKRLTAADTGNYTFSWTGGTFWTTGQAVAFTGVASSGNPIGSQVTSTVGTFGSITSLSLTVGIGDGLAWSVYNDTGAAHTPPTNFSEVADVDCASTAYYIAPSAGSTSAASASIASSSPAGAIMVALTAAGPDVISTGLFGTDWTTGSASKSASPAVQVGDLLVVQGISADANTALGTPTGGTGLTWTLRRSVVNPGNDAGMWLWTAPVVTAETPTLSIARSGGSDSWGARYWVFRNHGGVGATAVDNSDTGDSVLAVTTTGVDSYLIAAVGDWSAVNEAGTWSGGPTGATEVDHDFAWSSGFYTVHIHSWAGTGATGTSTITLDTATAMTPSMILAEILDGGPTLQDTLTWQVEVVRS